MTVDYPVLAEKNGYLQFGKAPILNNYHFFYEKSNTWYELCINLHVRPILYNKTFFQLLTIGSEVRPAIECERPKNEFESSEHLINLVNAGREFQLIHGREPLADLKLLLQSIDKSQSTSILDEFEALRLYERFKDVLELANSDRKSSILEEIIYHETGVPALINSQDQLENDNRVLVKSIRDPGSPTTLRKFTASRTSKLPRPRVPIRFPTKFRRKRELENPADGDPRSTSIKDRTFIAGEVETTPEKGSPTARLSDPENAKSTINIHITGVPKVTKSDSKFEFLEGERTMASGRFVETSQNHDNNDKKLEIFVSNGNSEFPNFPKVNENLWKSTNFTFGNKRTLSPMPEPYKNVESESKEAHNTTENDWGALTSLAQGSDYFGTNYEFTFPESPIIVEDDDSYEISLRFNDTVEEFKAQLNRMETRVVVIESSLYDLLTKFGTNKRSSGTGNQKIGYTSESDDFPYSESNATEIRRDGWRILKPERGNIFLRRYVLGPGIGGTHFPEKNSTYVYLGDSCGITNDKSFRIKDKRIARLIPIRSNRRWRTVTWQPRQGEAPKISEFRERSYLNWTCGYKVHKKVHSIPCRQKLMQQPSVWRYWELIAQRFGATKVSGGSPTRSAGRNQSSTFLSNIDGRSRSSSDHFSREQYNLRAYSSRSTQQGVWPLNPAWNSTLSTERTKRKSSEMISRGRSTKNDEPPLFQGSVVMLETQIPKPLVGAKEFKDFDNRMGVISTGLATLPMAGSMRGSFDEEDDWNWNSRDEGPSFNFFVANGQSSSELEWEASSGTGKSPETIIIPIESENPEILEDRWEVAYPSYLDYSENLHGDKKIEKSTIAEGKTTGSSMKVRKKRRIHAQGNERKKRSLAYFYQGGQTRGAIISGSKSRLVNAQSMTQGNRSAGQRSKRSVQIADWLRATLSTRLTSTEELTDTNLTNAKLFEIPIHSERYRPYFIAEDDSIPNGETSHVHPKEVEYVLDHSKLVPDTDELFRKKSAADFFQAEAPGETIISSSKNRTTGAESTIHDRRSSGHRSKDSLKMTGCLFGEAMISRSKNRSLNVKSMINGRSPSEQRLKRSVQMADWLRAAEEYHERLQQVRTAALRTWLDSRDHLADTNLTNVKLFTREIPTYLKSYRSSYTADDDSISNSEASQVYPIEVEDPVIHPSLIPTDDDELFSEFSRNQSASLISGSKTNKNDKNGKGPGGETSSSTARKFTITATGNSTIRIEELPKSGAVLEESLFGDQSAQGSIGREESMDRRTNMESDDFEHMYDGVDAEDEDFDYGDPNFALSRWMDEIDIIDASSVEIPVDKAKWTSGNGFKDEEDYEVDELLSRSKRDSPLFLFRVNGDPEREVLVWPSNWQDFINRHLWHNRTRNSARPNSPRRATKRIRTRISKLGPARTTNSNIKVKNPHESEAEILASPERTSDEEAERDPNVELATARRFQHTFDNRLRQNKRKNTYRGNIGNYS